MDYGHQWRAPFAVCGNKLAGWQVAPSATKGVSIAGVLFDAGCRFSDRPGSAATSCNRNRFASAAAWN